MTIATVTKQPSETLTAVMPFAAELDAILASSSIARGLVAGSAPIGATIAIEFGKAVATLTAGTDGERYLVTVRATAAAGEQLEAELEVVVIDAAWTMPDGGVAYLTIGEFVDSFGLDEVVAMTDRSGSGRIDRTYLVSALRHAQSLVDVHVAGAGYATPLQTVPDALKTAIADIARARLYPRGAPEGVADAAKEARALLQRVADGKLPLGLPTGVAPAEQAPSATPILISAGRRRYPDGLGPL